MDNYQAYYFFNHLSRDDKQTLGRFFLTSDFGFDRIIDTYDRFKRGEYQEESLPIILPPFFLATDIRNDLNSKNSKDQYRTNAILKDLNSFIDFINQYAEIFGYRYRADNPYDLEQDKIFKIIMWAGMWEPGDNGDIVILKEYHGYAADDLTYDELNDEFYFITNIYDEWSKITTDGKYTKISSMKGPIVASYYGYIYYIKGINIVYSNVSDLDNFTIFAPRIGIYDMDSYYKLNRDGDLFFIHNNLIHKYNFDTNEYYIIYNGEYGALDRVVTSEEGGLLCKLSNRNLLKLNNLNGTYEMLLYELEQNVSDIYSLTVDNYNRIFGLVLYETGNLSFSKLELHERYGNHVSIENIVIPVKNDRYGYKGNGPSLFTNIYVDENWNYRIIIDKHENAVLSVHSKIVKLYLELPSEKMVKSAIY